MALSNQRTTDQTRDSITSVLSLWEKLPETNPVPIGIANDDDFLDENNLIENDTEEELETSEDDVALPKPLHKRFGSSSNLENMQQNSPLWIFDEFYDQIKLILHNIKTEEARNELKRRLSSLNLRLISNDNEQIRPWHFGLSCIRFQLERLYSIDIIRLISVRSSPFWLRFKNKLKRQQQRIRSNSERIKPIRYGRSSPYRISLRYGALTKLDQFYYSPEHSWSDEPTNRWSLFLNNDYSGGCIEWVIEERRERTKKQLLANNVDRTVIVNLLPDGFTMYICQTCNMNEFSAEEKRNNVPRYDHRPQKPPHRSGPWRPAFADRQLRQIRPSYEKDKRLSVSNGTYFPTVQFELRINPSHLTNEKAKNTVRQTYKLLVEFFTSHNITVCYGMMNSRQGPIVNSFPTIELPSRIMRYSWQMLLNVGYRLQIQMDDQFCDELCGLNREKYNADDLFYRVCVYLWRLFTLEPFVNLSNELHDAINESRRKREDASFGLLNSLKSKTNTETYVPSVTLTPTTIRIKPLKLCRTNRVLRATSKFGEALDHFVLVEIRDENGQPLQSFHFQDLRVYFLKYLQEGFNLIDKNRCYRYLHHSQSQLRARQFWFYHHEPGVNLSFPEAYKWMGTFDKEKNVAKYASRVALCFSTTIPTIIINDTAIHYTDDIKTKDGKFTFSDGCGTMSEKLRDDIQKELKRKAPFSAVQFRFAGAKGVLSVDPQLGTGHHLYIRPSMNKFESPHRCFEVCKVSAARSLYLNRQSILLLSNRRISDAIFLILQQRNHLTLIRALLRNEDAKNLLDEKLPNWFLPYGAKIDFVHEPFFRQVLITACLISTGELLKRTRICVPRNKARNMFGIVDEYNVLKPHEVFIQYTRFNDHEDNDHYDKNQKTEILNNRTVVITKNPCHHPGDVRTFTAVDYKALRHLKDVIVFSQQGDRPASHQISGSDLDGDEYAVIWYEDLVPQKTPNATPYNFDSQGDPPLLKRPVSRDDINEIVLNLAESDFLGRLSNLHLAYADRFGVNSDVPPNNDVFSTIELAGKISEEVDSGKTGQHPLNEIEIKKQGKALGNKRPDFMAKANMESYHSEKILGQLYRSSRRTLPAWNRLLRRHRHLRHLQVRTPEDEDIDDEEQINVDDIEKQLIPLDHSLLNLTRSDIEQEISLIASQLFFVYRQEILEILNLYELSHESDLWCRRSTNNINGELEDTAYTQLEQLAQRTRDAFFLRLISYCGNRCNNCEVATSFENLCGNLKNVHNHVAVALYMECYSGQNGSERAPILSLPWLFTTALLQSQQRKLAPTQGLLSVAMKAALQKLIDKGLLQLGGLTLTLRTSDNRSVEATVRWTVCVFVEILHYCLKSKLFTSWPMILSQFIRSTESFTLDTSSSSQYNETDEWLLVFDDAEQNDLYAGILFSTEWTENDDERMHSYFIQLLEICFTAGRAMPDGDNEYLRISEEIILILQRMAIDETPWPKNSRQMKS